MAKSYSVEQENEDSVVTKPSTPYAKVTGADEGLVKSYRDIQRATQVGAVSASELSSPAVVKGEGLARRPRTPIAERNALSVLLRQAKGVAQELRRAPDDPVEHALITEKAIDVLEMMWEYRDARQEAWEDDEWGDLLNLLQIALKEKAPAELTSEQRGAVADVIGGCLCQSEALAPSEVKRAMRFLKRAGFNVWHAIAGEEPIDE